MILFTIHIILYFRYLYKNYIPLKSRDYYVPKEFNEMSTNIENILDNTLSPEELKSMSPEQLYRLGLSKEQVQVFTKSPQAKTIYEQQRLSKKKPTSPLMSTEEEEDCKKLFNLLITK